MERRYLPRATVALEKRVGSDYPYITGFAAVYYSASDPGTEFELWNDDADRCVERLMRGCFDRVTQNLVPQVANGFDVAGLFNHDPNQILGRVSAGTMTLSTDSAGLKYSIAPPDAPLAQGIIASIKRGDICGSSFSFTCDKDGQRWIRQGNLTVREIHQVSRLYDVGPVTFPAYSSTTAGARAAEDPEEARKAFLEHERRRLALKAMTLTEVVAWCAQRGL